MTRASLPSPPRSADEESGGIGGSSGVPSFELGKIGDVARRIGTTVKDGAAGAASGAANLTARCARAHASASSYARSALRR